MAGRHGTVRSAVAAQRAGIDSTFLRRDHVAHTELSVGPTVEIPGLDALVDHLTGRPVEGAT